MKIIIALSIVVIAIFIRTIIKLVSTGRKRMPGAKARRRTLLPFIYGKKKENPSD